MRFRGLGSKAGLAGLVASLLVAMVVFGMPVKTAVGAATNGAAFGLFLIGWIVLCAIFVCDTTDKTGKFEEVRHTIAEPTGASRSC